jgi:hypothetical protein
MFEIPICNKETHADKIRPTDSTTGLFVLENTAGFVAHIVQLHFTAMPNFGLDVLEVAATSVFFPFVEAFWYFATPVYLK